MRQEGRADRGSRTTRGAGWVASQAGARPVSSARQAPPWSARSAGSSRAGSGARGACAGLKGTAPSAWPRARSLNTKLPASCRGCFPSPPIRSGGSTLISSQGRGGAGPGVPTQVLAAMGAVMGTFSSLQTKQRRTSKGKPPSSSFCPPGWVSGCWKLKWGVPPDSVVRTSLSLRSRSMSLYPKEKEAGGRTGVNQPGRRRGGSQSGWVPAPWVTGTWTLLLGRSLGGPAHRSGDGIVCVEMLGSSSRSHNGRRWGACGHPARCSHIHMLLGLMQVHTWESITRERALCAPARPENLCKPKGTSCARWKAPRAGVLVAPGVSRRQGTSQGCCPALGTAGTWGLCRGVVER